MGQIETSGGKGVPFLRSTQSVWASDEWACCWKDLCHGTVRELRVKWILCMRADSRFAHVEKRHVLYSATDGLALLARNPTSGSTKAIWIQVFCCPNGSWKLLLDFKQAESLCSLLQLLV